jgi:hypothetical protein
MNPLAHEVLTAVRAAGGDLQLVGKDRLKLVALKPLPDKLVQRVRAVKPNLLEALGGSPQSPIVEALDAALNPDEKELAAIIEFDGGIPREWAEALARLDPACPPQGVPTEYWLRFINACGSFLDGGWHELAVALGWGPLELFGCDGRHPLRRIDSMGLLWRIAHPDDELEALTRNAAIVKVPNGGAHYLRRRPTAPGQVLAWELVGEAK